MRLISPVLLTRETFFLEGSRQGSNMEPVRPPVRPSRVFSTALKTSPVPRREYYRIRPSTPTRASSRRRQQEALGAIWLISSHRFGSSCFDYLHRCCHAYLCHQVTTNHNELDGITSVCRLNTGGLGGKEAGFLPLSVSPCNSGVKHSTDVLPVLCRISACTSRCLLVLLMPKLEGWRFTGTGMTTVEFAL